MTDRNVTILHAIEAREWDVDKTIKFEVDHVERDDENNLTIYGVPGWGAMYYMVLDQWVIDQIDRLNRSRGHYVICESSYMGMDPRMYRFSGTYRDLLYKLHDVQPGDDDFRFWSGTPKDKKDKIGAWSDRELKDCFDEMNGDGCPWVDVWSMDGDVQVIGQR